MPWSVSDVEKHAKGLSSSQKSQWVAIANSVLSDCLKKGGKQSDCEGSAIRQANGIAAHEVPMHYYKQVVESNYSIRHEQHQGRKHLVVPVVMMVSGVHAGSHGPLLHLAEDLGKFPAAWNGIPIAVEHPNADGTHVSCNDPVIIDSQSVGRVYNTFMEDDKLRAEAWLDEEALKRVSPQAFEYIMEGKPLDVSVGVFTEDESNIGNWNGEHYEAIARNHRPDHLALLPGGKGACSWADGCGVRAHSAAEDVEVNAGGIKFSGTESGPFKRPTLSDFGYDKQWSDLTSAEKQNVANHFLSGTASASTFDELKLPVVNPKTGKLNERSLRAVISGRGAAMGGPAAERQSARQMAYHLLNSEFDAKLKVPDLTALLDLAKELAPDGYSISVNELSFNEVTGKIQEKLDRMDDDTKGHFLVATYPDYFIYGMVLKNPSCPRPAPEYDGPIAQGISPSDGGLFKRSYSVGANNTVDFTGEAIPVVRKVEYVDATEGVTTMSEKKPCCPEKVELLIQSSLTLFEETDRDWLLSLSEDQLEKLTPTEPPEAILGAHEEEEDEGYQEPPVQMNQEQAIQILQEHLGDSQKFLNLLSPELRGQVEFGLKAYKEQRQQLINHITGSTDVYQAAELTTMSMDDLNKLARAVKPKADFTPMGPTQAPQTNASSGELLLPLGVA